jgi:outer membrane protein
MVSQRNLFATLIFVLSCFVVSNCISAELKIGVMNVQKIIVECDAGKAAKGRFDAKMKELQATFKTEEDALKDLQEEIKKKSSAWSEDKKAEKVREFQNNGRELKAKTDQARYDMKKLQDKELEPILKALEKVVNSYGKKNGYSAIMDDKNGIIYFDESLDITDVIIKKLNGELSKK